MNNGLARDDGRFHLETTMTGPHENLVHQSIVCSSTSSFLTSCTNPSQGTLQREIVGKTTNNLENKVTYIFTKKDLGDLALERIQKLIQWGIVSGVETFAWKVKYVHGPTDSVPDDAYGAPVLGGPVQAMTAPGQDAALHGQVFPPVPTHHVLRSQPADLDSASGTTPWPAGVATFTPSVVQTPLYLPHGQHAILMLFQADPFIVNALNVATIGSTVWNMVANVGPVAGVEFRGRPTGHQVIFNVRVYNEDTITNLISNGYHHGQFMFPSATGMEHYFIVALTTVENPLSPRMLRGIMPPQVRNQHHTRNLVSSNRPRRDDTYNTVDVNRILAGLDVRTTIMLRNIPPQNTVDDVKFIIDSVIPRGYDFMYLRMDFATGKNIGYMFINVFSAESIVKIVVELAGRRWGPNTHRTVALSYATIQGKDCLVEKFRNSSVMDEPAVHRPHIFDATGAEVMFPGPNNFAKHSRSRANAGSLGRLFQHPALP